MLELQTPIVDGWTYCKHVEINFKYNSLCFLMNKEC